MKLGEGVEQAIHCVLVLSALADDEVLPAAALAEFHGVSASFLLKHLQALSGAGLVTSTSGPRGGYRLARAPQAISLLDVLLGVEGTEPAFRCTEIRQRGPQPVDDKFFKAPCAVNAAMLRAEQAYRAELRDVSLADLTKDSRSHLGIAIAQRVSGFVQLHARRKPPKE